MTEEQKIEKVREQLHKRSKESIIEDLLDNFPIDDIEWYFDCQIFGED